MKGEIGRYKKKGVDQEEEGDRKGNGVNGHEKPDVKENGNIDAVADASAHSNAPRNDKRTRSISSSADAAASSAAACEEEEEEGAKKEESTKSRRHRKRALDATPTEDEGEDEEEEEQGTVGQNNQEYRVRYWATRSSIRSFACTAYSFACTVLLASLVRSLPSS